MEEYVVKNQKKLRRGITTGTCSAAAAQAAASALLMGVELENVDIHTPKGVTVSVPVHKVEVMDSFATYMVIKDSGDDPDVTNHSEVYVRVEYVEIGLMDETGKIVEVKPKSSFSVEVRKLYSNEIDYMFRSEGYDNLLLDGGEGIGRVTKEGLEQGVGFAAINQVPRQMIFEAVGQVCALAEEEKQGRKRICGEFDSDGQTNLLGQQQLLITVSIPAGVALAKKTFNPKLGIEGGISVLGTSGILEPMSEQAIVATIETEIRQLAKTGSKKLLVTPGNYGQTYASEYLGLDLSQSVKSSNYIGETLDFAVSYEFEKVLLVGNIGKLVKLAAGIFNTHSKVADARGEIFAVHTALAGGNKGLVKQVLDCINTDAMLCLLDEAGLKDTVMKSICDKIYEHVKGRVGENISIGVACFSEKYGFLGMTGNTKELLDTWLDH